MSQQGVLTGYLFPAMLQIAIVALIAAVLRSNGLTLGYETPIGMALIALAGTSSALWGVWYQCRHNNKSVLDILKDFFEVRQSIFSYLLVVVFLFITFGGAILGHGVRRENLRILALLFLKALLFGGIEEIGWRYTFQPVMERAVSYIPAVLITFIFWGMWHFLFFYIDGSIASVNIPFFLLGLLNNCFVLSALYAYSGSLWICVMTHALINAFSQVAVDENAVDGNVVPSVIPKIVCMGFAVALVYLVSVRKAQSGL